MQLSFWVGSKKFGPSQKNLGPVKGQGIKGQIILKWCLRFPPKNEQNNSTLLL